MKAIQQRFNSFLMFVGALNKPLQSGCDLEGRFQVAIDASIQRGLRCSNRFRRKGGDLFGQANGGVHDLIVGHHAVHQVDVQRPLGVYDSCR